MSETIVHNTGAPAAGERKNFFVREHHPENGSLLGFWLYLMSDCLIFACLFATCAVLGRSYADGPTGAALFDLPLVAGLGFLVMLVTIIVHTFNYKRDYYISAEEVVRTENAYTKLLSSHV